MDKMFIHILTPLAMNIKSPHENIKFSRNTGWIRSESISEYVLRLAINEWLKNALAHKIVV